jgi:hypothetical protein
MHATIWLYKLITGGTGEIEQVGRQIASSLGRAPGFVSYVLLEDGHGDLAMIGFFEDRAGLDEADRVVGRSLTQHPGAVRLAPSRVISGEVLFQRGM